MQQPRWSLGAKMPFGKYKGHNVFVLLNDRFYFVWLSQQPRADWVMRRYPDLVPALAAVARFIRGQIQEEERQGRNPPREQRGTCEIIRPNFRSKGSVA